MKYLFRGKRVGNPNEWIFGDLNHIDGEVFIFDRTENAPLNSPDWFEVIPESVGQWTGLLDKNGVKIFEGDMLLIKLTDSDYPQYKFDGIYGVSFNYQGVCIKFIELEWEDKDKNQWPTRQSIVSKHIYERWSDTVGCYIEIRDMGREIKSTSIEVIGTVHDK